MWHLQSVQKKKDLNIKDVKAASNLQKDISRGFKTLAWAMGKAPGACVVRCNVCTDVRASLSGSLKGQRFSLLCLL